MKTNECVQALACLLLCYLCDGCAQHSDAINAIGRSAEYTNNGLGIGLKLVDSQDHSDTLPLVMSFVNNSQEITSVYTQNLWCGFQIQFRCMTRKEAIEESLLPGSSHVKYEEWMVNPEHIVSNPTIINLPPGSSVEVPIDCLDKSLTGFGYTRVQSCGSTAYLQLRYMGFGEYAVKHKGLNPWTNVVESGIIAVPLNN